jgi:hypothetical protein
MAEESKIKCYRVDDGDTGYIYEHLQGAIEHTNQAFLCDAKEWLNNEGDKFGVEIQVVFLTRKEIDSLPED